MARVRKARDPWSRAVEHLRALDGRWAELIERVGPCRLEPRPDRLGMLVHSIVGQQISTKAASAIRGRLVALTGEPVLPDRLLALGEPGLRQVGLSANKARSVLGLAEGARDGQLPFEEFDGWEDEAIVARLTTVRGIGVWTAEMFLIFALNRPDVLPVGDLGLRAGIRNHHGMDEMPKPSACRELAESWRPFRTVGTWYLWRGLEFNRQGTKTD